jgi:Uncharacterised nucleotidyltransferase
VSWSSRRNQDGDLLAVLGQLPRIPAGLEPRELFARAERHGLAGVLLDAWRAAHLPLPDDLARRLDALEVAQALDHDAHLALLRRVDARFALASLDAVVLKGPLFAERYYARPSSRSTTDVDVLVRPEDLDAASDALRALGYVASSGPEEERFRREHHHLHFSHPDALPLELHFHGYTGFGRILPSEPLIARRRRAPLEGLRSLGVLEPADELVFLAVHAGAHRFVRLGWLYDLLRLTEKMTAAEIAIASRRAREWGFGRIFAFAMTLLSEVFNVRVETGGLGHLGRTIARRSVGEPDAPVLRSATRLVYTLTLCDDPRAALRYATRAALGHTRRLFRGGS